jgi:hypothetical protein
VDSWTLRAGLFLANSNAVNKSTLIDAVDAIIEAEGIYPPLDTEQTGMNLVLGPNRPGRQSNNRIVEIILN